MKTKWKTTGKKSLAAFLVMLILALSIPFQAFAAADHITEITNGEKVNSVPYGVSTYLHEIHEVQYNGKSYPFFCVQPGVTSAYGNYTPQITLDSNVTPGTCTISQSALSEICKWIYVGYYLDYGDTLQPHYMALTQKKVWEICIRDTGITWNNTWAPGIESAYPAWCAETQAKINNLDTRPSFDFGTFNVVAGESITVNDSNGVFKDYPAFEYTENGITFVHNSGSNELNVSVSKDCVTTSYTLLQSVVTRNGWQKFDTGVNNYVYFGSTQLQDMVYGGYYDPIPFSLALNIETLGNLEITKEDGYQALIDDAEFGLYTDEGGTNRIAEGTVKDGKLLIEDLKQGTYYLKETVAPFGYILDETVYPVTITAANTTNQTVVNKEPTGSIYLTKNLAECSHNGSAETKKGNALIGDVDITESEFTLYASEDICSASGSKIFYKEGDIVATGAIEANEDGTSGTLTFENLPLGKYYLEETKVPDGTELEKGFSKQVSLEYADQKTEIVISEKEATNDIDNMKVRIFKEGIDGGTAGEVQGLAGAEFTIKLKSDYDNALAQGYTYEEIWAYQENGKWYGIDKYGNRGVEVDQTKAAEAQNVAPNYDKITTDSKGEAVSKYLPYGKYIVKETVTPKDFTSGSDFTFSIKNDECDFKEIENKMVNITVNNAPTEYYVKMVKKDADSGKIVSLNSTTFKIKAKENIYNPSNGNLVYQAGDYIKQKVGSTTYTEFTTNSDNFVAPTGEVYGSANDDKGTVVTPLTLPAGKYEVVEIKAPKGFTSTEEKYDFELSSIYDYDTDKDGDFVVVMEVSNTQPKGNLEVTKRINLREGMDTSLIEIDYTKIAFELVAAKDIIDMADGSIIYEEGQKIGKYNLNPDGTLNINNLWMGEYYLCEIETLPGCVLDTTRHEVIFTQEDTTTKEYTFSLDIGNDTTEVDVRKTDVTGEKELPGAKLTILDENGTIIDQWTSTDRVHKVEGLEVGKTYTLHEETAPNGYVVSTDVTFEISATGEVQKVTMVDKQVSAMKKDVAGNVVSGAELTVTEKETSKIVDSWQTTTEAHFINNLVEGKTYILSETKTPDGFVTAKDVEFTVTTDKETQYVEMVNKQVAALKVDATTDEGLSGAELQVIDKAGNVVDEWTSTKDPHFISGLVEGNSYTLQEKKAPSSYVIATSIDFEVTFEKQNQELVMEDKQVSAMKKDVVGNAVIGAELTVIDKETSEVVDKWETSEDEHFINNLAEGRTYILTETKTPDEFVTAKDIEFTVSTDKKIQYVEMVDKQVSALKIDATTGDATPNAELRVLDLEGNEIDKWTSTKDPHFISGLVEGEKYVLEEVLAADTYVVATSIDFEVTFEKQNQELKMSDKQVVASKKNVEGNNIAGAELVVTNVKTKQIVDKWTTSEDPHFINGLIEGQSYVLSELKAPDTYVKSKPVEFTVTTDKEIQYVEMTDKQVSALKLDESTGEALEGAELQVLDKDENVVDEWISTTDTHYISNLAEGETYILHEKTPPVGFEQAEDIEFTVTEEKTVQELVMNDKPIYSSIQVEKVDSNTGERIVSNMFEFTLYSDAECSEVIETKAADTSKGTALFENLKYGIYYIKETAAPTGYELSDQVVTIRIDETGVYADDVCLNEADGVYSFKYVNSLLPEIYTGDEETGKKIGTYVLMGAFAAVGITGIILLGKKRKK